MLDLALCSLYFPLVSLTSTHKDAINAYVGETCLKNFILAYNGLMSAFSGIVAVGALYFRFFVEGPVEKCGENVYESDGMPYYATIVWLFFASKYIEWLDTVLTLKIGQYLRARTYCPKEPYCTTRPCPDGQGPPGIAELPGPAPRVTFIY